MLVKIKRQTDNESEPYWQTFEYKGTRNTTVASLLDELNYTDDLYDIEGNPAPRIRWECSCMQKLCGACAMIINGIPALACNTFLNDMPENELVLEPLSKFPVVADLIVDRSIIEENLKKAEIYMGEFSKSNPKEYEQQYSTAKCLKCGLCLEICPNYKRGENFYGALFANNVYLIHSQSKDRKKKLKQKYASNFAAGCSKVLSCEKICPMGISTLSSMLKMN
ncbi:MAG: 2Fe-2S iron-sulfur cluster-binding protein [Lachnospiraceae bacterium]